MVKVAVNGATGRMGRALVALIADDPDLELVAALESAGHPRLGDDAGRAAGIEETGVTITDRLLVSCDVLVDFSRPAGTLDRLARCVGAGVNMVIGTTGFTAQEREQVLAASHETGVLLAPNMSLGANLLHELAATAARALTAAFDLEIVESHHRFKADAPSGTALSLAREVCEATGRPFDQTVIYGRRGQTGERPAGQIAIHAVRGGDIVGEHRLIFAGLGERVELVHVAHTRSAFAQGAVRAVKFIAFRPPGLYTMADVLAEPPAQG